MSEPTSFVCSGCGERFEGGGLPPFKCPRALEGDNVDHVLERRLDVARVPFPAPAEDNPFVAFRTLLGSYQRAGADAAWVEQVTALDRRVAEVDGRGFSRTPLVHAADLARAAGWNGQLRVKDETGNVAGSHKARHLMGLLLYLETVPGGPARERPLAISSCGNAALAAAVVARAADRTLRVFVPSWAEPDVLERLGELGAQIAVCERDIAEPGDPCTLAFRRAVAEGAIPFSCQGSDNGLVVEGGMTLAYEMIAASPAPPARLFVQVGGGALASATVQAYEEAERRGGGALPRVHAVQTQAVAPLCRAWARVMRRLLPALGCAGELPPEDGAGIPLDDASQWADLVREHRDSLELEAALGYAATHRNDFMWPWEGEPHGLAHGILDDETYDWFAVVRGMLRSGGFPIVVSDETIAEANRLAREQTTIPVDATGSSGFAGLLALARAGIGVDDDAFVLFTGRDRTR